MYSVRQQQHTVRPNERQLFFNGTVEMRETFAFFMPLENWKILKRE